MKTILNSLVGLLLLLITALLPLSAAAQTTYPVQANVVVQPPYSVYLTDYYTQGSQRLKVQLLLKDLTRPAFPVKLRFKLEGSALSITSREGVSLPPFTLEGGIPVAVSGDGLAPYLSLNALIAGGADAATFLSKGQRMPDGFYKLQVWAEEMGRSVRVSNVATTVFSTMLYQPPLITTPADKAIIPDQGIQNILFQWLPRHLGASMDITQSTVYRVRLVEVWPKERDPQEAIRSSRPLYESLTGTTSFIYGSGQPTLISGRRYALQVQAQDAAGRDLFQGGGYSNVICFTYGEECRQPSAPTAQVDGISSAAISWSGDPRSTAYTLAYRPSFGPDTTWKEVTTGIGSYQMEKLQPATAYRVRVNAQCGLSRSIWSAERPFATPERPDKTFECKPATSQPAVTDRNPKLTLESGEVITAADFKVTVLYAQLSNGRFTGNGLARIPFLRNIPASCQLVNVQVNAANQLIGGSIVLAENLTVLDNKMVNDAKRLADDVYSSLKDKNPNENVADVKVGGVITDNITVSNQPGNDLEPGKTTVTVTTSTGDTKTVSPGTNTRITDSEGNVVTVSEGGAVVRGRQDKNAFGPGATSSAVAQAAADDKLPKVTLTLDTSKPYFGHDTSSDGGPWVSIPTGKSVAVTASIELQKSQVKVEDIRYRTNDGMVVAATGSNPATLEVYGRYGSTPIPVLAVADTGRVDSLKRSFILGKINTVGYDVDRRRVWLVPVNGATAGKDEVAKELNRIYRQGVVEWDVQCDPSKVSLSLSGSEVSALCAGFDADLMSSYTDAMKVALQKFGKEPDERTYLIFMVPGKGASGVTGFMPLNRSAGFIYTQGLEGEPLARAIAHELGHGAFGLEHVGFAKDKAAAPTDNLMDYSGGTALTKAQWDAMHSEYRRITWFQGADEGKSDDAAIDKLLGWLKENQKKNAIKYEKNAYYKYHSFFDHPLKALNGAITLYVELGDDGDIDLSINENNVAKLVSFEVDLNQTYHTGFNLTFKYTNKEGSAIKIWAYKYEDFVKLLSYLGYHVNEDVVFDLYSKGFEKAGPDNNQLEVIYESIPSFVVKRLPPSSLTEHLALLSEHEMSNSVAKLLLGWHFDTDEEMAVLHILEGLQHSNSLYSYLYENPKVAINLYSKVDGKENRKQLLKHLMLACKTYWNANEAVLNERYTQKNIFYQLDSHQNFGSLGDSGIELWGKYLYGQPLQMSDAPERATHNPLAPVFLIFNKDVPANQVESTVVPVLFFYGTLKSQENEFILKFAGGIGQIASFFSGAYLVVKGTGTLTKVIGWTSLLNETTRVLFDIPSVKSYLELQPWGEDFVSTYRLISTGVDIASIATGSLTAFKTNAPNVRKLMVEGKASAKQLEVFDEVVKLSNTGRFIAKSGDELRTFLSKLTKKPIGKSYTGDYYRSLSEESEVLYNATPKKITPADEYSSWGRYDLDGEENAMYLTKTEIGNKTELSAYGKWTDYNTYKFENVTATNLLDLTDDAVRQQLGTQFDDLVKTLGTKKDNYDIPNVIASWARKNGYNGIIAPGSRGQKNYENIILFEQSYTDRIFKNIVPQKIKK